MTTTAPTVAAPSARPATWQRKWLRATLLVLSAISLCCVAVLATLISGVRQAGIAASYPNAISDFLEVQDLADEAAAARRFLLPGISDAYPPTGQWHLHAMHVLEARALLHRRGATSGPLVAVYDGMLDMEHPDIPWAPVLAARPYALGYFGHWLRGETHGTGVASTIAGRGELASTSVAPDARLVPFERYSGLPDTGVDTSLRVLASRKVRIANYSLALELPEGTQQAVDETYATGLLAIAGLFNHDTDQAAYPGHWPRVLTVSGSTAQDEPAGFGWGPQLDLLAPAPQNALASPQLRLGPVVFGQRFGRLGANSISVALTSGVAALVLQADPTLTSAQLEKRLKLSARKPPGMQGALWHPRYGYGVVDAYAAITYDTTGPEVAYIRVKLAPDGGVLVEGMAIDTADDAGLLPGRARDSHLLGVPVSSIARVDVRAGDDPWQQAVLYPLSSAGSRPRHFTAHLRANGPVSARAWDTAGNLGPVVGGP